MVRSQVVKFVGTQRAVVDTVKRSTVGVYDTLEQARAVADKLNKTSKPGKGEQTCR